MKNFHLELENRSDNEVVSIDLSRLEEEPTQLQEYASFRFRCDYEQSEVNVY